MTTKKLTIKMLRDGNPREVASLLGIGYTGDTSAIPHGGAFYELSNWDNYGYAECVRIQESEGTLWLECGTINKPNDIDEVLSSSGWKLDDSGAVVCEYDNSEVSSEFSTAMQIECVLSHWGMDVDETKTFQSDNGEDYGNFPEFQIWRTAKPLILALAS